MASAHNVRSFGISYHFTDQSNGGYRNLRIVTNNKSEAEKFFCKQDIKLKKCYNVNIPLKIHISIKT